MRQAYGLVFVAVLGIVVGLAYFYYSNQPTFITYSLGEEIRGYPAEELSITFGSVVVNDARDKPDRSIVAVTFTMNNIANRELDLWDYEISTDILLADPLLKYGDYYAEYKLVWLIDGINEDYKQYLHSLMPNQELRGLLQYEIMKGYQPTQLVYPDEESPTFIVELD